MNWALLRGPLLATVFMALYALAAFWYVPLGFGRFESAVSIAFLLAPVASGLIAGLATPRISAAIISGIGAVAGVVMAWLLTILVDRRELGDAFWAAWALIAFLVAGSHVLGAVAWARVYRVSPKSVTR